jgi:hypothetical protein
MLAFQRRDLLPAREGFHSQSNRLLICRCGLQQYIGPFFQESSHLKMVEGGVTVEINRTQE